METGNLPISFFERPFGIVRRFTFFEEFEGAYNKEERAAIVSGFRNETSSF